jgi:hypothetical protein
MSDLLTGYSDDDDEVPEFVQQESTGKIPSAKSVAPEVTGFLGGRQSAPYLINGVIS